MVWEFVCHAFCPTGEGGGRKNDCGKKGGAELSAPSTGPITTPKDLAAEYTRLHNAASKEYAAAFKAAGARMWGGDLNHPHKAKNQEFVAEQMAGMGGAKGIGGVYMPARPLTILDSYPEVRRDRRKMRQLETAVREIHARYTGLWKKTLARYRPE